MAVPCDFEGSNHILDKPESSTYDECQAINVLVAPEESTGNLVTVSCWKLTQEELEEINKTKRIWLVIYAPTMFPSAIDGIRPFNLP